MKNQLAAMLFAALAIMGYMAAALAAESLSGDAVFNPPQYLEATTAPQTSYKTPMQAAITLYSAMARGDYQTWLDSWEPAEKQKRIERDRQMGRTPDFWVQTWKKNFTSENLRFIRQANYKNHDFTSENLRFIRQANYKNHVLIGYEMVDAAGKVTMKSAATFKEVSKGDWRATNELANDPVYQNFP